MNRDLDRPSPIVLVILDGFGLGQDPAADAIRAARMQAWRALVERWPHCVLGASGTAVGLPAGRARLVRKLGDDESTQEYESSY